MLSCVDSVHDRLIYGRRVRALAVAIAGLIPAGARVVDVGCGDGRLAALVAKRAAGVRMEGYDVLVRRRQAIPIHQFDGSHLPLAENSADIVMMVDVLHHAADPMRLLREARRVARQAIIIKDHRLSKTGARAILTFMDWVGNRPQGVSLPYNYWTAERWQEAWSRLDLAPTYYETSLSLYPPPASWVFEAGLHFVARLDKVVHR
ncbi:MAG: class I SAM-dependent methyltransferase [Acidobacteria bacterium]|nr:MAG: class I SAM-dependent methyltransferase [Acidobacteriota bacterium]